MTTRKKDVAERVDENTFCHELRFLTADESWTLFCEKAFKNLNADEELENLGKEMVKKCGGLPLAIIVLGGLLSKKRPQEWSRVRDHIWRYLSNDSIEISSLLDLSFEDLSSELKVCFLYLGHFPEDYEISSETLIQLWVAEGFTQQKEKTLEESAADILNELINRSLVQISGISRGRIVECRVHDLLHDLAIQKAKDFNFIRINDEANNSTQSSTVPRRQAVHLQTETCSWLEQCNQRYRSLLLFNQNSLSSELSNICKRFRFLRVLNLSNCGSSRELPEEIGMLIHLKYLGLENSWIQFLPPSIGNLCSLQTLTLPTSSPGVGPYFKIPVEICKLKKLRHLIGYFAYHLPLEDLTNLQTLRYLRGEGWTRLNTEKLVNLRELRIYVRSPEKVVFTFDSIAKLKNLQILSVEFCYGRKSPSSIGPLQPLSHCKHLRELTLSTARIDVKLPGNLHEILPNLENLILSHPNFDDVLMPALEKLPNLTHLELALDSSPAKKIICSANGFPRLEFLALRVGSHDWHVEEGALPMLRRLVISTFSRFTIPERLASIEIEETNSEVDHYYFGAH